MRFFAPLALAALFTTPLAAQTFDYDMPCGDLLDSAGGDTQIAIALWAAGYLAGAGGTPIPMTMPGLTSVASQITSACVLAPETSLIDLVAAGLGGDGPGSDADARVMLGQFLDPAADRRALTAALKPSAADVALVYEEPLAGKLIARYDEIFTPDVEIGPKPGQTELLSLVTLTDALIAGSPVLREFPGGYEQVLPYLKRGVPMVRFKFVEPGSDTGLAFDGLVYVNDHWVLMPSPWSVLE